MLSVLFCSASLSKNLKAEGASGQQKTLKALAQYPEGLGSEKLQQVTGLPVAELEAALDTLARHDVVHKQENRWQIIVELCRRWVERDHSEII